MAFVAAKCTSCGGILTVDDTKDAAVCQYCGTPFVVEKAVNHFYTTNHISGSVVNFYGETAAAFVIRAGKLERYQGSDADVTIPTSVSIIGEGAFEGCNGLKSVTIPSSVTKIEDHAFAGTGIKEIKIPDSVTFLGNAVFRDCINMKTAILPKYLNVQDGQQAIPHGLFLNCRELIHVPLPDNTGSIGEAAFKNCASLKLKLPAHLLMIGKEAFFGCSNLDNINIPDSVCLIGENAFGYCINITQITIPNKISGINKGVFCGCSKLQKVTMSSSVVKIGTAAFCDCKELSDISFSDKLKSIGSVAFADCRKLTNISLPHGVVEIGGGAFRNCVNLRIIVVPNSVKTCYASSFEGCPALTIIASKDWKKTHYTVHTSLTKEREQQSRKTKIIGVLIMIAGIGIVLSSCAHYGIENGSFWGGLIGLAVGFVGFLIYIESESYKNTDSY